MNAPHTLTPPVYQIGDSFRVSNRRLHTGGTITRINRVNVQYEAMYQPSPTFTPIVQSLKIARHELDNADIVRPGVGVIQRATPQH